MPHTSTNMIELSVIIPISEFHDPIRELHQEYRNGVDSTGLTYEFLYVIDGEHPDALKELNELADSENITIIKLTTKFGESTALNIAFSKSCGRILLTLPAYRQIDATEIPKLVAALDHYDMALARRYPRKDSLFNRAQSALFNSLLGYTTDLKIHDAGCGARALKRIVIDEVKIYGDLHRFMSVIAHRQGFRVAEVNITQSSQNVSRRIYSPGVYIRRLLDLLTVFFLLKFTKKPLRFFGLVGLTIFSVGFITTLYLIAERLFFDIGLSDRPALFLSSLLIVLGVQIIAIGLIGEIIIFTHARRIKEYTIDKIIN
jgi:glycosyltransferase involved in cell wall biosynthesis